MLETLIRQYTKAEDVTESFQHASKFEWVCRMNNTRNRTEEVVLNEISYTDKRMKREAISALVIFYNSSNS